MAVLHRRPGLQVHGRARQRALLRVAVRHPRRQHARRDDRDGRAARLGLAKLDKCSELPEYHTDEKWDYLVDINRFLIPDSCDKKAEGLVFKNYSFINKFGRNQVFGKIVTDAFKRGPKISKIPTEQKDDDAMQKLVLKYPSR